MSCVCSDGEGRAWSVEMNGWFVSLTVSLVLVASMAAPPAAVPQAALDDFLRGRVAAGDVPAVVAMVVDRHSTTYAGAFGKQNVAQNRDLRLDAIFRIASMTKPVTSLAAMMLYEEGRLSFDDPVTKFLPELANRRVMTTWHAADNTYESRSPKRVITVRDLLTHTSGIGYPFADARLAKLSAAGTAEADLPLLHDPGERFTYGPSTALVGRIVEKIAGEPLDQFFRSRIFDPLEMADTFFVLPPDKRDRVVTVHARAADGSLVERPNPAELRSDARGDGGLFSTAADYSRFMQLFLNGGRTRSGRLVKEQTLRTMTSNQIGALVVREQPSALPAVARPFPIGAGKDKFGFGFQIEAPPAAPGMRSVDSLSWGGIDNTHFWIDPRESIAAVVLMQLLPYYDDRALAVLRGFERTVYGRIVGGAAPPLKRDPAADAQQPPHHNR